MKQEELARILEAAPKIGGVEAKDFIGFVSLIERRDQRTGAMKENPYMAVDGRVAMARLDHIKQQGKLDQGPTEVVEQTERTLTVQVKIVSSLYGTAYGTATSRLDQKTRKGDPTIESASPWEVAETSAIGRALGMLGYGLLPGAGLASAEDMERATEGKEGNGEVGNPGAVIIPWGKHKGKKVADVAKEDPSYLDYIMDKSSDEEVRRAVREYLEEAVKKGPKRAEMEALGEEEGELVVTPEGEIITMAPQSPTTGGLEKVKAAVDEELTERKALSGSTAFWARARGLKISTPDGKSHLKNYTGEDGRIDWAKATEALGKEG